MEGLKSKGSLAGGLKDVHGGAPFPITIGKLRGGAAILKDRQCRSAEQDLYTMRKGHVMRGHKWTQRLTVELRDCARSCERGLGPARQADPLPLSPSVVAAAGKLVALRSGINAVLVGAWWLQREIELAGLRRCDCEWSGGAGCGSM